MQSAIAQVSKHPNGHYHQARLLFDTGSHRTFITEDMRIKLNLEPVYKESLHVTTFGSNQSKKTNYDVVTFNLLSRKEDISINALVTTTICPPLQNTKNVTLPLEFKHLELAEPLHSSEERKVDILIGSDYYTHLITGKMNQSKDESLLATESKVGWLLSGSIPKTICTNHPPWATSSYTIHINQEDEKLDELLTKFWEVNEIPEIHTPEHENVSEKFLKTIHFDKASGTYNVQLPWKSNKQELPTNFELSKRRLKSLIFTLKTKDPALISKYNSQLMEQLDLGFIEKVQEPTNATVIHYIPHFPVFKDSATTKMRIVYDASAKTSPSALCLNDCLYSGPNLIQNLSSILIKFRKHKVAFVADIEKAFLQIALHQNDRDTTRFLWLKDTNKSFDDDNIQTFRFRRVLFGAAPSPFLLNATLQHHLHSKRDWIAEDLSEVLYMDNVVSGTSTDTKAKEYYIKSRNYLKEAGMNLRQWTTNSINLDQKIKEDKTEANKVVKVLGLVWDSENDSLSLAIDKLIEETKHLQNITKRKALSIASKLFDPLGFVEPITVKAKIMIQELWKLKIGWDDNLPEEQKIKWEKWISELCNLKPLSIQRPYLTDTFKETQLHIFCDSSKYAYGAVAYFRGTSANNTSTAFVMAKTKVAPVKTQTLPRLELSAALLGANMLKYLQEIPRFLSKTCKITLWSDSQIVLSWLTTKKQLQQYVCSRVEKINQITSSHTWKYCPTSENPADLLTRGLSTAQLNENLQLWLHGPPWLTKSEQEWPTKEPNCTAEDLDVIVNTTTLTQKEETNDTPSILNIIHLERYSSWSKVLRVTALVIRAHKIWKKKTISQNLTATDISEAETILIKATQQKRFAKEITHMKTKTKSKSPALISQLQLYLDKNDIIRCRGRIDHSELSMDTKFPILLPKADHLTTLIVRARHDSVLHGGVAQTLTDLRQRYWIPQGRQSITKIISKCLICKKAEGRAFSSQPTPPLPKARVTQSRVFQSVGVDYAGPLYVRNQDNRSSKVYICLFTCASTRALHLEIAEDMTTKAFLGGFRRFISRRGIPESILSDNAKTFKVGAKTLKSIATQMIEKPESQKFLSDHGINWHFIPEAAPWWGGFYERMVGLVKRPLKKVIGRACLNVIELSTILTEVEAVLNSRPLTYTYVNTKEEGPLTPAHFLCGHRLLSLPDQQNSNEDYGNTTREELSRRAKYHETLIHSFWKRWQQEYLTGLREQYCKKRKAPNYTVSKGDVVLIHDHIRKRNQWKMGVVTTLYPGKDGLVRSVTLRTSSGQELNRPIEKLYPMEIQEEEEEIAPKDISTIKRPVRLAAVKAAQRIKEQCQ